VELVDVMVIKKYPVATGVIETDDWLVCITGGVFALVVTVAVTLTSPLK
jgi:hypothetical protein